MAYATPQNMLERFDVRHLSDLVSDADTGRLQKPELLSHPNLQAALDDAAGQIEAALLKGERYSIADLESLTANSRQYLIRLNCQIAIGLLWQRRPWSDNDQRADALDKAEKGLKELSRGEAVFDLAAQKDAGLPRIHTPAVSTINRLNLVVDRARAGFYPSRLLPGQVSN